MGGLEQIFYINETFEQQMLDKYPDLYKPGACDICKADLRYLDKIHRINMKWYCDKCYKKYGGKQK